MCTAILACAGIVAAAAVQAADEGPPVKIADAWVAAVEKAGGDAPLLMTIHNDSSNPDALMRIRCPAANFAEKHTVDRGEGAPAMRAVKSIPIEAGSTVTFRPDGYHVMLLQTKQLKAGDRFTCSVDFQKAGTITTEVQVR